MRGSRFPSIEDRFMLPVVILSPKDEGLLDPNYCLRYQRKKTMLALKEKFGNG